MARQRQWIGFDTAQLDALGRSAKSESSTTERTCPACGNRCVRSYRYFSSRVTGPTVISYVWCACCHRYAGSTGPRPPGLDLEDPLTPEDHRRLDRDLTALLGHLDHLWEAGRLPQRPR